MLFNSYGFIFVFLPIAIAVYFALGRAGLKELAFASLVTSSFLFYGWWNPAYLGLILLSIMFNFGLGSMLGHQGQTKQSKLILTLGVITNLATLGYFKYANFFVDNVNVVLGTDYNIANIILPLAISFFTFQQIAYLVDAYRGEMKEYNFLHYCLFVTFFPQLIAGPIVHHKEMMPQFMEGDSHKPKLENFQVGITVFVIGLFKKVVLADNFALYATPMFDAAHGGATLSFTEAWVGSLCYTFQLYFDFSGYCDMAMGVARIFGIKLPLNFDSPYKAINISDFWRRWYMTLSRFLRDYVYIALGGNRAGQVKRYRNLLLTMLIGGLWHGAGWTFVIWGALHGTYLCINHGWWSIKKRFFGNVKTSVVTIWAGRIITFVAVVFAWVFFRAVDFDSAISICKSMIGANGITLPASTQAILANHVQLIPLLQFEFTGLFPSGIVDNVKEIGIWIMLGFVFIWGIPNSKDIMTRYHIAFETYEKEEKIGFPHWMLWQPNVLWAVFIGGMATITFLSLSRISEFLYFQF